MERDQPIPGWGLVEKCALDRDGAGRQMRGNGSVGLEIPCKLSAASVIE